MTLKQALAANRWLRVQFACLIAVALCVPAIIVFTSAWVFLAFGVFALIGGACWVPSRQLEKALETARVASAREAAELRTPRAPDAGPDQCPVCGGYGLNELAADDAFMEREPDRAKVVAWGRKRAHRDCAEFVPYVPTEADRQHEKLERWQREDRAAEERDRRTFEESWPRLLAAMTAGWQEIRVSSMPTEKHYLLQSADLHHSEILAVRPRCKAADGFGWLVSLDVKPLHAFPPDTRLMPLDSDRLWNREAGRPYTRTELGLCDCQAGPIVSGRLRASIDVEAVAALFAQANDRPQHMSTIGNGWPRPDLKGRKR